MTATMARKRKKGLAPGQIPDWRPGAVYWKPLADGREVTIYPLLGSQARLCVGPLADPQGYDVAYLYDTESAAIDAAGMWDGENMEEPPGYVRVEFESSSHIKKAPIHSRAVEPGTVLALNDTLESNFEVSELREAREKSTYKIEGLSEDGFWLTITADRSVGDPCDDKGAPLLRVRDVRLSKQK